MDAIDLIRGPQPQSELYRCGSCLSLHVSDGRLPTGGVSCSLCGERIGAEDRVEYASLRPRLIALAIDLALLVVPLLVFGLIVVAISPWVPKNERGTFETSAAVTISVIGGIVLLAYLWICDAGGISAGQWAAGIQTVRASTGGRPGVIRGLVRLVAKVATLATLGLGYAVLLLDAERRTVHDWIADTRVIERI